MTYNTNIRNAWMNHAIALLSNQSPIYNLYTADERALLDFTKGTPWE